MELEQLLIGVSAQAAVLVHTERGTVTTMQSAPRTMSVETITASTTGIWQNQKLTAAFQVTLTGRPNKGNSFRDVLSKVVYCDLKLQR